MTNLHEGARPATPDPLHEAMRRIDDALASIDRACEALFAARVAGAPTGVLIQAAAMLMAADTMLLRRALRTRSHDARERT